MKIFALLITGFLALTVLPQGTEACGYNCGSSSYYGRSTYGYGSSYYSTPYNRYPSYAGRYHRSAPSYQYSSYDPRNYRSYGYNRSYNYNRSYDHYGHGHSRGNCPYNRY